MMASQCKFDSHFHFVDGMDENGLHTDRFSPIRANILAECGKFCHRPSMSSTIQLNLFDEELLLLHIVPKYF